MTCLQLANQIGLFFSSTTVPMHQSGCFIIQLPRRVLRVSWLGTYPGACFGSVFQEKAPSCVPAFKGIRHASKHTDPIFYCIFLMSCVRISILPSLKKIWIVRHFQWNYLEKNSILAYIGLELLSACLVAELCQASKVFLVRKEPLSITR